MDKRTAEDILKDRREADKRRFARWKERQEAKGKRHISGMISAEAYDLLSRQRDQTGESVSSIVEKALLGFYGEPAPVAEMKPEEPEQVTMTLPLVEPKEKAEDEATTVPPYNTEEYKVYVIDLVCQLNKEACPSFTQAIKRLNDRGVRSYNGKGNLNKGTVSKWMKARGIELIWDKDKPTS